MRQAAILWAVDYAETPAPPELRHLAKSAWTLSVGGDPGATLGHIATPDGCMEMIRRIHGRSRWGSEQPRAFVAGLTTQPAELTLGGNSRFVGLRVWPWAWNRIGKVHSGLLIDRWADLAKAAPDLRLPDSPVAAFALLDPDLLAEERELVAAILESSSVAELARRTGRPHRWLQRWFERNVGLPPRSFFRLLRFSTAFEQLPSTSDSLAGHAAEHGYADQAHMSREFRSMSGTSAARAKARATGPFL